MFQKFPPWISVIVILQSKSFSTVTAIQSFIAKRVVSSCCSASKRRDTDSSPSLGIHQHQCGPTTEDYHAIGSQTPTTSRPFNSRPGRGNQPTAAHTWHKQLVYVKEEGKSCLAPKHCKHCSVPLGREGAERRRDEPDADIFRDHCDLGV